jgi:hemerythrin-like domain-containing protein
MSDEQPGLRRRLAHASRRLSVQHEYLDALLATTRRALERNTPPEAREALHAFRGALDAHFALEEQVHFPALHGLDPARDREIEVLVLEHRALRDRLLVLEGKVGREPRDGVARDFVDLGAALRDHESREERLFEASARPAPD